MSDSAELPFEGETGAATLEGTLLSITFRNEDNGYTVARIEVHGRKLPITVVSSLPGIEPGDSLALSGRWATHPSVGRQLEVKRVELRPPTFTPRRPRAARLQGTGSRLRATSARPRRRG